MFNVAKYYNLFLQPDELEETKLLKLQLKDSIILNKSASIKDINASCICWKAYMQGIMHHFLTYQGVAQRNEIFLDFESYRLYYGDASMDIQVFHHGKSDAYHKLQKNKKQKQKQKNRNKQTNKQSFWCRSHIC